MLTSTPLIYITAALPYLDNYTYPTLLSRLISLQKKAIRIIIVTGSDYFAHTSPLFKQTPILKIPDICKLYIASQLYLELSENINNNNVSLMYYIILPDTNICFIASPFLNIPLRIRNTLPGIYICHTRPYQNYSSNPHSI